MLYIHICTCIHVVSSRRRSSGGDRPAGHRRRRGLRRHGRRLAVCPTHIVGRRRRGEAGFYPVLQQGVLPRGPPPRRDGPVHGSHGCLRQAQGPGGQRQRRRVSSDHVRIGGIITRMYTNKF